jgi:hypothetical protein
MTGERPGTAVLYHPAFEPPQGWLRAMLLFYDCVHSIVPPAAGYEMTPATAALVERDPIAFVPLDPQPFAQPETWDEYRALLGVLRQLQPSGDRGAAVRTEPDHAGLALKLEASATDRNAFVAFRAEKMPDEFRRSLLELGSFAEASDEGGWMRVDSRVADLLVSMLADRMATSRASIIGACTDRHHSFALAAKSELERHARRQLGSRDAWDPEASLAAEILSVDVPDRLGEYSIPAYLEVRERYREYRDEFRLAMRELRTLYLDRSLRSPGSLADQLQHAVSEFRAGMEKLQQGRIRRLVRRWVPIVLGSVVSVAAAVSGSAGLALGGEAFSFGLQVFGDPESGGRGTCLAQTQGRLVQLRRHLDWDRTMLGRVLRGL